MSNTDMKIKKKNYNITTQQTKLKIKEEKIEMK